MVLILPQCSFASTSASPEAWLALLTGQVILADIARLDRQLPESQDLAERVLADPAVRGNRRLEADARWARAYALAMLVKMNDAEVERMRALDLEYAAAQGPALPGVLADAKYYVCAGNVTRALAILREAVAEGCHDPIVLHEPAFASLRDSSDFAPIAAAVTPHDRQTAIRK